MVLFPGFVVYQFFLSIGAIPAVFGGLFGGASAAFGVIALVQLAAQLRSARGEVPLLQWCFVLFGGYFLLWVVVAGAVNTHTFTAWAAIMESLGTLVIWLAVFFVGSRLRLQTRAMKAAIPLSALILIGIVAYAIASQGSVLGPYLLFVGRDDTGATIPGVATYQGVGRSVLIVALVIAALQRRFWKQASVLAVFVAVLLCLGSRAHLIGALLCFIALGAAVGLRKGERLSAFLFGFGAIAISYVSMEIFLETRASEFLDLGASSSWLERLDLQHRAVQVITENPMTGDFGYHHWGIFAGYAHNALSAWAGFGFTMFLAYLGLVAYALYLSAKRALGKGPVDPLWLIAFQTNMVAVVLALASEPIFASVFPAFGWGITVNALRQERWRQRAAKTVLGLAAGGAEHPIAPAHGRLAGSLTGLNKIIELRLKNHVWNQRNH